MVADHPTQACAAITVAKNNLYTTTGLIKPSGLNMAATIEETIPLLTGEVLGCSNF
jgi:hypothetical protein